MKKQLLILIAGLFLFSACHKKEDFCDKQSNGLHYTFKDYIGPDSCMLYECAYQNGEHSANTVFLTICKGDKPSNVNWNVKSGKTTSYYQNSTMYKHKDTAYKPDIFDIGGGFDLNTVVDTEITMVPETSLVFTKITKVKK